MDSASIGLRAETRRPFVSVIVPVYEDMGRLALCLAALDCQSYPSDRYEVVVVDNASDEDIGSVVSGFVQARMIVENRPGSYAARNRGAGAAHGEIIAFTDADCIPAPDWVERGVESLSGAEGGDVVAGRVDVFFCDPDHPTAVEQYDSVVNLRQEQLVARHGFGVTANLIMSRAVFERVGPFDDRLKSTGDAEWCWRATRAGFALRYAESAVVSHPARRTLGEIRRKATRLAGGRHDLSQVEGGRPGMRIKGFFFGLLPPLRGIALVLSSDERGITMKLRVILVMVLVKYTIAWERLRLLVWGESRRR